jgi:hypothetical protein
MYVALQFRDPLWLELLCDEYYGCLVMKDKRKMVMEHGG